MLKPEQTWHQDRGRYLTLLHGCVAQVCRRQASWRATSPPLQHITQGDPGGGYMEATVLRRVTGRASQIPKLQCWAVLKTHPSAFFTLFNLPSIVKPPPRKKILCINQKWKFHTWNLFQSSATSTLKQIFRFLNGCLVPFSECPPRKEQLTPRWRDVLGICLLPCFRPKQVIG